MTAEHLICTHCSRAIEVADLCWCSDPICWSCHDDGGHYRFEPEDDAA